ncbi:AraC family transcriptional regulator [Litchfieldella qijiaojingensis]|uniref:AraC family transcriptional regulator n=1 Tax=Litchfieldella qijiaojingensis TaxID=980347 RepID=A0ABQ2YXN1_9GAMM|nr:AraC family transcriptional regulator [Halomonas qijiaojingensis]GGX98745.1 AraC family transcriptional regulator [Halomonas qijiaojingensis]
MAKQSSQFDYFKSQHIPELTVLQAALSDFSYDRHAHEEYAFGVTLAGRQDFFSGGQFHRSPPGNVIQFNPEEVHDGQPGGESTLGYVMVYVPPTQLEALFADAVGCERAGRFRSNEILIPDPALRSAILDLAHFVTGQVGSRIDQEHALYQMVTRLVQRAGKFQPGSTVSRPDALLLRAKDYILAHLEEDMSLDAISQAAHLSKYHFLRLFRQQFGITPHQYVLNCRINAARNALEAGVVPNEVAFRYGFVDLSHFNRRFKRIYGMTPYQYQRSVTN